MLEAKDLEKKDVNVLCMGKSDPYAVISVGAQEYKTKIIDGSVDPKWDFWCEVYIFCGFKYLYCLNFFETIHFKFHMITFLLSSTFSVLYPGSLSTASGY